MNGPNRPAHSIRKRVIAAMFVGTLIATPTTIATANGGGGGGASPSASAPQYNPAEEYRSGVEALNAGEFDDAARHLQRVSRVARDNADVHYLLGVAYFRGGNAKRARRPLEAAVRHDPEMIVAQRDLAIVYAELGRDDDAREILAGLATRSAECGETCAEKAALDQAVAAIEGALAGDAQASIGPDMSRLANAANADALYYQAVGLINEGKFESALMHLDDAALAFGPHPDILTYQGFANRKLARFDRAESYYNSALAIAPDHLGAIEYYGELKVERGDIEGARAHLARLEQLCAFGCFEVEELRSWIDDAAT